VSNSDSLTRVRLVIGERVLNLLPGSYLIGRGPQCHIVLDDPRVSRMHAQLSIDHAGVAIQDTGSANGIFVNGERVAGLVRLASGDCVVIGRHELRVQLSADGSPRPPSDTLPEEGPGRIELEQPDRELPDSFSTTKSNALELLAEVAEKALAAGDASQAETVIHARLIEVLDRVRTRQQVEPAVIDTALRIALGLAHALRARRWLDYALELLTVLGVPCSPEVLRQVRRARATAGAPSPERLAAYGRCVRALPMSLDKVRTVALLDELAE
jgi:pSer/pThr/pTyr-binding forkhead associated (FHA) protein